MTRSANGAKEWKVPSVETLRLRDDLSGRIAPLSRKILRENVSMARKRRPASEPDSTRPIDLFEAIGGSVKCRELSTAFYSCVAKHPALRPPCPATSHRCAMA